MPRARGNGCARHSGGGAHRRRGSSTITAIESAAADAQLDGETVRDEIDSFVERGVLVWSGSQLRCKVPLFERWLRDYGLREIRVAYADDLAVTRYKAIEEELQVKPREIEEVLDGWGAYRGRHLNHDDIRQWLAQFQDRDSQRLMFRALQGVRFYDGRLMREKLREAHEIVRRDTTHRIERGRRKRADILVSYLDGPGKSGARCAHLYADENNILASNVLEPSKLQHILPRRDDIQALVFLDDFVGTGGTASAGLRTLKERLGGRLDALRVVFIAMTGFVAGKEAVEETLVDLELGVHLHLCDPLTGGDRVFSDSSRYFTDPGQRERARSVAYAAGVRLDPRRPLGHAAVAFDEACPNNSLPILWERKNGWRPLFPRWSAGPA